MTIFLLLLAAIALPPKPDHYVTDRAGILKNAGALNEKLASFERQTSDQILVYVDEHLPPNTTIEEMGSEAMRQWGVGQKGKDNGAILFVFTGDRKMRIEVGYGLEGSLTDAKSKRITATVIKPEFQRGDFDAGINEGVDAMLATVRGEEYRGTGTTVAETRRSAPAQSESPSIPIWREVILPAVLQVIFVILFFGGFFFLAWMVLRAVAKSGALRNSGTSTERRNQSWTPGSSSSSSSSSFSDSSPSSDSSSSSSSSFSGGGGSGGGGGATDSW